MDHLQPAGEWADGYPPLLARLEQLRRRPAIDDDHRRFQPVQHSLQPFAEKQPVIGTPDAAVGADRYRGPGLNTVETESVASLVAPTDVGDHVDPLTGQPIPDGSSPIGVPQLHGQRQIAVEAVIRRYHPLEG